MWSFVASFSLTIVIAGFDYVPRKELLARRLQMQGRVEQRTGQLHRGKFGRRTKGMLRAAKTEGARRTAATEAKALGDNQAHTSRR